MSTAWLIFIIIIIFNRRSGIASHTSRGHKTGTRSMKQVRSVPLRGPVVVRVHNHTLYTPNSRGGGKPHAYDSHISSTIEHGGGGGSCV